MYKRFTLLALVLVMLVAAPQFEAMPTGIGSAADGGCSCHAGASPDTNVIVTGLPGSFNASETYAFTVTVQNDVMELYNGGVIEEDGTGWNGRAGGFRILSTGGMVSTVNESLSMKWTADSRIQQKEIPFELGISNGSLLQMIPKLLNSPSTVTPSTAALVLVATIGIKRTFLFLD